MTESNSGHAFTPNNVTPINAGSDALGEIDGATVLSAEDLMTIQIPTRDADGRSEKISARIPLSEYNILKRILDSPGSTHESLSDVIRVAVTLGLQSYVTMWAEDEEADKRLALAQLIMRGNLIKLRQVRTSIAKSCEQVVDNVIDNMKLGDFDGAWKSLEDYIDVVVETPVSARSHVFNYLNERERVGDIRRILVEQGYDWDRLIRRIR